MLGNLYLEIQKCILLANKMYRKCKGLNTVVYNSIAIKSRVYAVTE